ncbi:beta-ketoacyl synthase chain length factor [Rhodanobacter caeni]|uniref:Beta-ketoacyl synthase chain length factor n=1 Tax=Rhodanobacter caeni TaxID=657654 RepID=A0ABP3E2Q5_9GAMM
MTALRIHVEGIGLWSPQLADFEALRRLLDGDSPTPPAARPAAAAIPPNERRRAPEGVLLAVEAAGQAVAMSGRDAAGLACVFASSHGDQSITDYMCATLAHSPTELSPIRFHNSVHNAPAGYWTIAVGCREPSTAVCGHRASFGAGLLEAASQVLAEQRPVLLVCMDTAGSGPLGEVTGCRQPFACALVLAPAASASTRARLDIQLNAGVAPTPLAPPLEDWREANASAEALPLLALLARAGGRCQLAASDALGLQIDAETAA